MKTCKIDGCESTELATRSAMCKTHHREYNKNHYARNKQKYLDKAAKRNLQVRSAHREILIKHLKSNPCLDCGNSDIEVLQFDHRDRAEKLAELSKLITGKTETLLAELSKCDVRCANCHVKKTRRQMGWWTSDSIV